jgi:putative hydrolase of the HAD superfamily
MMIKAVFFDMGGTLETFRFTREYRIQQAPLLRKCLEGAGITLSDSDEQLADRVTRGISSYHKWNLQSMVEIPTSEIWGKYVFAGLSFDQQALASISEEFSFLYETGFYIREMRPGVPNVLEQIRSMGLKIGCISNTQSLTQVPSTLKKYGIQDYFDTVVLSSVYGRRKPDPAIFYYATQLAKVPTGVCVYVGDKINRDVLGAKRAGFKLAVQIRHEYDDGDPDEGAVPDYVISNLQELIGILEQEIVNGKNEPSGNHESKVKAIFFDAGDILYYRPKRNSHFKTFLESQLRNLVPEFEQKRMAIKDLAYSGKMSRSEYFEALVRLYGVTDEEEIAEGVAAIRRDDDNVAIFEGVPETVTALKERGYLLGIITDTAMPFSRKLGWFEQHGFGHVWDVVVSSKEVGIRKPAPIMYQKALEQTGLRPDEAVFIGHKAYELEGARKIGMHTIAFNYDKEAIADYYIKNFQELLTVPLICSK